MTNACDLVEGPASCQLRIIRKISKGEVRAVARFCKLASSDKLLESLGFPYISQAEYDAIEQELARRLEQIENKSLA